MEETILNMFFTIHTGLAERNLLLKQVIQTGQWVFPKVAPLLIII